MTKKQELPTLPTLKKLIFALDITDEDVIEQSENYKKIRVPCTVMYSMDNKAVLDNQSKGGFYDVVDVQHDFDVEPPKTILTLRR